MKRLVEWTLIAFASWAALAWLGTRPPPPAIRDIHDVERHFGMVSIPLKLLDTTPEASLLRMLFLGLIAVAVLMACALASIYLVKSARIPAARLMATSLAYGAAAVSYAFFVRVFPSLGADSLGPRPWLADAIAGAMYAWALITSMRFFASYPFAIDLGIFIRDEIQGGRVAAVEARLPWMYRKVGAWRQVQTAAEREAADERFFGRFATPQGWAAVTGFFALLGAVASAGELGQLAHTVVGSLVALYVFWFGFGCLRYKYRRALEEDRNRIRWLYFGAWAAGLMLLLWAAFVTLAPLRGYFPVTAFVTLNTIAPVLMGIIGLVSLAISTFYGGAIDPDLAIRRATLYAFCLTVLAFLFVAFERVVAVLLAGKLGMGPEMGSYVAAALAAVTLLPLRRYVERGANRLVTRLTPVTSVADGPRREAAVAFSDLSGYTALTARDERTAMVVAALFHREAQRLAEAHGGRLVKTIGDAVHLEFPSSAAAVAAVRQLHDDYRRAASAISLPVLGVHSGVHFGEVMAAPDNDIYGAVVNLAARLQGQARDGEIVVSQVVRDACAKLAFEDRGQVELKNVPERVQLYLLNEATGSVS